MLRDEVFTFSLRDSASGVRITMYYTRYMPTLLHIFVKRAAICLKCESDGEIPLSVEREPVLMVVLVCHC